MENYETQAQGCWTIHAISKKPTRQCFSMSIISKIFERKIREYLSLAPIKTKNKLTLQYKERESPILHVEQVSKNLGEHDRLQILVDTFTGQVVRWWDTHQSRLKTWTTSSTDFIEIFDGRKLTQ